MNVNNNVRLAPMAVHGSLVPSPTVLQMLMVIGLSDESGKSSRMWLTGRTRSVQLSPDVQDMAYTEQSPSHKCFVKIAARSNAGSMPSPYNLR